MKPSVTSDKTRDQDPVVYKFVEVEGEDSTIKTERIRQQESKPTYKHNEPLENF